MTNYCRLCGNGLAKAYSFAPTPLANSFPPEPDADAERFPLDLMKCISCNHVQLGYVPDRNTLYRNYKYSTPRIQLPDMRRYALQLKEKYPGAKKCFEIGANNGLLIQVLKDTGFFAIGIDPSPQDWTVWEGFFDTGSAWRAKKRFGTFDLIIANNVLAHIDNLEEVIAAVDLLLSRDGALIFEVQYLIDLLDRAEFDMVYHEHHDYHHIAPLLPFFRTRGFVVTDVEKLPNHGGSIRVTVKRHGDEFIAPKETLDFDAFSGKIESTRDRLMTELKGNVAAFGATAKSCTLIHHFGLQDIIRYVVDETPAKLDKYIAGTNIRICPPAQFGIDPPDTLLLTAWNYADMLRKRFAGMNIVVPF